MGTRSRIAIRNADNTFSSIYCHWDGYPSNNGMILRDHYTTTDKVQALIALGDLSSLHAEIGKKHKFEARNAGCTAYGRDRGEKGKEAQVSADLDELKALTQECGGEWLYVWTGHGWKCAEGGIGFFGMPSSAPPADLESVDYYIVKEAHENAGA